MTISMIVRVLCSQWITQTSCRIYMASMLRTPAFDINSRGWSYREWSQLLVAVWPASWPSENRCSLKGNCRSWDIISNLSHTNPELSLPCFKDKCFWLIVAGSTMAHYVSVVFLIIFAAPDKTSRPWEFTQAMGVRIVGLLFERVSLS